MSNHHCIEAISEDRRRETKKGTITFEHLHKDKPSGLTLFYTELPSLISGKQDIYFFKKKDSLNVWQKGKK